MNTAQGANPIFLHCHTFPTFSSYSFIFSYILVPIKVWSAWLLPPPLLPGRPAGEVREARAHRPHPHPLQLRLLRQSCSWQQVSGTCHHTENKTRATYFSPGAVIEFLRASINSIGKGADILTKLLISLCLQCKRKVWLLRRKPKS